MEYEMIELLDLATLGYISKPIGSVSFQQLEVMQFWEMLNRLLLKSVRYCQDKNSAGPENSPGVFKCTGDGGRNMLKDIG